MARLPLFVRRFIFDFATTAAPALLGLSVAGDPASVLHAAGLAVGAAAVSAAVRALPGFAAFLAEELAVDPAE